MDKNHFKSPKIFSKTALVLSISIKCEMGGVQVTMSQPSSPEYYSFRPNVIDYAIHRMSWPPLFY